MNIRFWKVYGEDGHRQRESFRASDSFTTLNGNKVEVWNSDKTGTNEYTIVKISAVTKERCQEELDAQIYDGIFENSEVGKVVEINEDGIEIWDGEIITHEFEDFEELEDFIEKRKEDKLHHYYWGFMECFDSELYTIADLEANMEPGWFECNEEEVEIYEWTVEATH